MVNLFLFSIIYKNTIDFIFIHNYNGEYNFIKGDIKMKVGIMGATGYGGLELVRFLSMHPEISGMNFYSTSDYTEDLSTYFPHLATNNSGQIKKWNKNNSVSENDILFFATPHGVSSGLMEEIDFSKTKLIDLSGDFRLKKEETYQKWYKHTHPCFSKTNEFTYGLSELNREAIKQSNQIANPGCYPTATLLGLAPLLKAGIVAKNSIIVDAKSGISGAGKTANQTTQFMNRNENLTAYKITEHQHIPEIEQIIGSIDSSQDFITFTPHLVPMTRGILSTIYVTSTREISNEELKELYNQSYEDSYFVRVRDGIPCTKDVYGSNFCDIYATYDDRTNRITIVSVIDNLVKGAAGQAIQNMNIMLNLPDETGLQFTPIFP